MIFKAAIDTSRTLKKGMKITLHINDEAKKEVLKHLYNFEDMPLEVEFRIDVQKRLEILSRISEDQRRKIYAILRDIANWMGDSPESAKHQLKLQFTQHTEHDDFSLSDCSSKLASDFIDYLIIWAFMNGVALSDHPKDLVDSLDSYIWICLKTKKCCICGKPMDGPGHHVQPIGMGRDRKTYDDSEHEMIALCREHHIEVETIGWETFAAKYHVKGVK